VVPPKDGFAQKLHPIIHKQDTKYKKTISIQICVSCAFYKLAQGEIFSTCYELFALGSLQFLLFCMTFSTLSILFIKV